MDGGFEEDSKIRFEKTDQALNTRLSRQTIHLHVTHSSKTQGEGI